MLAVSLKSNLKEHPKEPVEKKISMARTLPSNRAGDKKQAV